MANFQPRQILDNVLFSAADLDPAALAENLAKLSFVQALGAKLLVFEDIPYHVDYVQLASNVKELDRLISLGQNVTARDVVSLPSVIVRAPREDATGNKIINPPHALYSSELIWPSFEWPVNSIMSGVVLLIGDTGAGKTHAMVNSYDVDIFIRYSEPQEQADTGKKVVPARSLFEAISFAMALGVLGARCAIDSLRSLVYTLKGNAVTGGMSGAMYDVTTQFNNVFADIGVVVMMALNPLAAIKKDRDGEIDSSATDDLVRKLASGVAGAIHIHNAGEVKSQTYRLTDGRFSSDRPATKSRSPQSQARNPHLPSSAPAGFGRETFTTLSMRSLREGTSHDQRASALGPVAPEGDEAPRTAAPFVM